MKITKAIITAAGKEQSHLPLQTVVDRFGQVRCALELLVDEVVDQTGRAEQRRMSNSQLTTISWKFCGQ